MRGKETSFGAPAARSATILLATMVVCAFPRPAYPQAKAEPKLSSFAGCIDEENGRYVLVDERELKPIADLEPDHFPVEAFAKDLGKKVIVRGVSTPGEVRPMVKVRSIETVSETCAPQQNPELEIVNGGDTHGI